MTPTENIEPKSQNYFCSVQTTRIHESLEGLNSSLAESCGEELLFKMPPMGDPMHFLQFSDFGVQWGFWAIFLVPDMLEGQSRAL